MIPYLRQHPITCRAGECTIAGLVFYVLVADEFEGRMCADREPAIECVGNRAKPVRVPDRPKLPTYEVTIEASSTATFMPRGQSYVTTTE